ncbi:methionine aminopeptidase 1D, mitochondrial-like [Leguminivora glycinivorella]|uniref:methionine aminopeptidase 1D, mitochondrial-like n=1 Tax=Leguminivora glycinivorella TaxID=1035111 RepID=UPI00200E16D0|nr:methionine aminopeptidase 1D, mitochondrial-like [Leguminivora glycinivorella]
MYIEYIAMELPRKLIGSLSQFWKINVLDIKQLYDSVEKLVFVSISLEKRKTDVVRSRYNSTMRVPKALNPRLQKQLLLRFGVYETVYPVETTPSRTVPDHIEKPEYVLQKQPTVLPDKAEVKDVNQLRGMRRSCKLAANILAHVQKNIYPGITTDDIDGMVHKLTVEAGAYPSPLHYKGFPKSVCTSVNNVAVHGIPDLRPLRDGDIINVDITVSLITVITLCWHQYVNSLQNNAIKTCGPEVPFSEIGASIFRHSKRNGLTVLPAFIGHGIGRYFHGPPDIYHTLNRYRGRMRPGMTFTIEPVLSHGSKHTLILPDGWTVVTEDGARSAQAEHTVLVTEDGAEILTK